MNKKGVKERKIFLSNMNTWFSNFIIEEFRTDYLPDTKRKNEFMGTKNGSSQPLPLYFNPKETKIEIGYNYNQEVFTNDVFIYNLDDSNLAEVDFIIRGLKANKYETEKILILVSSIMTWAKTPLKIKTQEEIDQVDFNEEEFIPYEEPEKKEETPEIEEAKEENKTEEAKEETQSKPQSKQFEKKNTITKEQPPQQEETEVDKGVKEISINPINDKEPSINDSNKEIKKERIFYYKDTEFKQRIPDKRYFQYKILETLALNHNNPNLKVYIICPGFIYGCGENFFFDYFRLAWLGRPNPIPIIGDGMNSLPTIHIMDLVQVIKRVIDKKPLTRYIFAVDKTKNPSMKNILQSIANAIGGINVKCINDFNLDKAEIPLFTELSIDVKIKTSKILIDERKPDEDIEDFDKRRFNWHCEYGIPENQAMIRDEFNLYRNLKSIKIYIGGPPTSGKTELSKKIAKKLKITHLLVADIVEWGKNLNDALGEEVRVKYEEIEENVKHAIEEHEKKKSKRKNEPPFDVSALQKLPNELLIKIIKEKLKCGECTSKGYILDGFPRQYQDAVDLFKDDEELNKQIVPDSVIFISNATEESLRNKLMSVPGYDEDMAKFDNRFNRRYQNYKSCNEGEETKKITDFFEENNIDVFNYDDVLANENYDEQYEKLEKFLERNGAVDNYDRLVDEDYEDELRDLENIRKEDDVKEKEENEAEGKGEDKDKEEAEKEKAEGEEEQDKEKNGKSKNENKRQSQNESSINISKLEGQINMENSKTDESKQEIRNEESLEQMRIREKMNEQIEREEKLLEKKSEVLRRYLSEKVIPILAKGVLHVCHSMPDDPVDALANYLLDNCFKKGMKTDDNKNMSLSQNLSKHLNNSIEGKDDTNPNNKAILLHSIEDDEDKDEIGKY